MLHTKFCENRSNCSGEEDFGRDFTMILWLYGSPFQRRLQIKFGFDLLCGS